MTKNYSDFCKILVSTLTLVLFSACGEVTIAPKGEPVFSFSTESEVCTEDPKDIGQYTKIMFVVDTSGSNSSTDTKQIRYKAIKSFFDKNKTNKYIAWGFIEFHGDEANSLVPEQGGANLLFTYDPAVMEQAINEFKSLSPTGSTPYKSALQLTTSAISADLQEEGEAASNYNIIFVSDGDPTDYGGGLFSGPNDGALFADVQNLVNLSAGNIHLSTIYYGHSSTNSHNRLSKMAEIGLGKFQDTNIDPVLDIDSLIMGSNSQEPYLIKNFVVYNLNAANCDDGTVGGDSDSDGLCDKDEERYNKEFVLDPVRKAKMGGKLFNSQNRNSFSPLLSDLVYYKYFTTPAGDAPSTDPSKCDGTFSEPDLSTKCEKLFYTNNTPQGPTDAWTKKMSKNGDPKYYDTDGDGFLDYLEFIFYKDKSSGINFNNIAEKVTGFGNLDKAYLLLNHLNPQNPMAETPYGVQFHRVQPNSRGQNCYSYSQEKLPLYFTKEVTPLQTAGSINLAHNANENVILIYYTQVLERDPNSKAFLRYSYQKLKKDFNGPQRLNLDTGNFQIWKRPIK